MRRVRGNASWIDGDLYIHVNIQPVAICQGSRQRAMPCIVCATPAGGQPCHLVCIVAGIICPVDNSHLNGAGFWRHATCLPKYDRDIYAAVIRALQLAAH